MKIWLRLRFIGLAWLASFTIAIWT